MSAIWAWDLAERQDVTTYEGRKLARLRELISHEHGKEAIVSAVWELKNGYTNLGTYVVAVALPSSSNQYHLVVQFGMSYSVLRRDQELASLLELDGFEVLVEYQELVRGVTIEPTLAQTEAFLAHYAPALETWVAMCRQQADMGNPLHLLDLEILRAVGALFSSEEHTMHRRARRHARDLLAEPCRWRSAEDTAYLSALHKAHECARRKIYAWWQVACADYSFPPAPLMDHEHPRIQAALLYREQSVKKVPVYGQVAVVPNEMKTGFDLVDAASSRRIATWFADGEDGKAGACVYAPQLSALTDWQRFDCLSTRQRRGLSVRLLEIRLGVKQTRVVEQTPISKPFLSEATRNAGQPEVVQMSLF